MIYPSFDQIKELLTEDLQSRNLKNADIQKGIIT